MYYFTARLKNTTVRVFSSALLRYRTSLVAQRLKRLSAMRETRVRSLGQEDPLEKEMATHSSILAWSIPWMEDPGRLQSTGSQRVGHDWVTSLSLSLRYNWHVLMCNFKLYSVMSWYMNTSWNDYHNKIIMVIIIKYYCNREEQVWPRIRTAPFTLDFVLCCMCLVKLNMHFS